MNVYGLDITDRRHSEEELRTSLDFTRNLIETADTIIMSLDEDANIETFNPCAERLTGYSREEVAGRNWFETFIPERDRARIPAVHREVLRRMPEASRHENPMVCKNGEERLISWRNTVIKNRSNRRTGVLSIGIDITERRKAEEELARHREHLEDLVRGRTAEIEEKNRQLERMNRLFVGREFRIKELRDRIKEREARD